MPYLSSGLIRQRLCSIFSSVTVACPKGIYVAPVPDDSSRWAGVFFVRKGPYANAVLRFTIAFPDDFPACPPNLTLQTDVFHPLVTPLTTYTHSTRDTGHDTVSAADRDRLPPGGLSLRHGFPEWFAPTSTRAASGQGESVKTDEDEGVNESGQPSTTAAIDSLSPHHSSLATDLPQSPPSLNVPTLASSMPAEQPPHIVEVLQYLRVIFDTESVLDDVPLEVAANQGAWHAWRSYRMKSPLIRPALGARLSPSSPLRPLSVDRNEPGNDASIASLQQPGGARRPGEWNWQGVWEDRVRKSIQSSISDPVLFGGEGSEVIGFLDLDPEAIEAISTLQQQWSDSATL